MYWSGRQTRTTNRKMVHMEESRQGTWFGTVYFFGQEQTVFTR